MMPKNYKEITDYEAVEILGMKGLFTNLRVDSKSLPENIKKLSIRHSDDCDEWFCSLEENVLVNHMGDFITMDNVETKGFCKDINDDYSFLTSDENDIIKSQILG